VSEEEVDLVVIEDHLRAEEICKALKHAGIHHVEFWPEHLLRPGNAYSGSLLAHGMFEAKQVPDEQFGPFHIRVRAEDLAQAQLVLTASGLVSDQH
jgi:hypothetical protein